MIAMPVLFADAEAARKFIERRRWPKGADLPVLREQEGQPARCQLLPLQRLRKRL